MRELFGVAKVSSTPTGVDIEYFRRPPEVSPKADLVFLGSMDWMPNIDGVQYSFENTAPCTETAARVYAGGGGMVAFGGDTGAGGRGPSNSGSRYSR